ncbi:MAG: STAS/SEC14 domain-containing protein [Nannocystaceae bacterium]
MAPLTHYTEEPSTLSSRSGRAYTRVHGGGFVTREMLERTLRDLRRQPSPAVLVDLRDVAGYEAACLASAAQFLRDAPSLGLTRVALVGSSTVMRTASQLLASSVPVELRTFEHELQASQWLQAPARETTGPSPVASESRRREHPLQPSP